MVAVDFTASNGPVNQPTSLHFMNKQGFNSYQQAIISVGSLPSPFPVLTGQVSSLLPY